MPLGTILDILYIIYTLYSSNATPSLYLVFIEYTNGALMICNSHRFFGIICGNDLNSKSDDLVIFLNISNSFSGYIVPPTNIMDLHLFTN